MWAFSTMFCAQRASLSSQTSFLTRPASASTTVGKLTASVSKMLRKDRASEGGPFALVSSCGLIDRGLDPGGTPGGTPGAQRAGGGDVGGSGDRRPPPAESTSSVSQG